MKTTPNDAKQFIDKFGGAMKNLAEEREWWEDFIPWPATDKGIKKLLAEQRKRTIIDLVENLEYITQRYGISWSTEARTKWNEYIAKLKNL